MSNASPVRGTIFSGYFNSLQERQDFSMSYPALPDQYNKEAAYYSLYIPANRRAHDLRGIIAACDRHIAAAPAGWDATDAEALRAEAKEYLAELDQ